MQKLEDHGTCADCEICEKKDTCDIFISQKLAFEHYSQLNKIMRSSLENAKKSKPVANAAVLSLLIMRNYTNALILLADGFIGINGSEVLKEANLDNLLDLLVAAKKFITG